MTPARRKSPTYRADGYQLVGEPKCGGFGAGFLATHPDHPGRHFFIKFPKDPTDPEHVKRLRREARNLEAANHPNVVRLLEHQLDSVPPFIVLEYHGNGTLAEVGRAGVPTESALTMLMQVADALHGGFHARGGFHRDVKPENILLTAGGMYILADAGLARVPAAGSTGTRTVAGTPGYIDPWVVNHDYDAAADIWSLGVTFGVALTGRAPHDIADHGRLLLRSDELPIADFRSRAEAYRLLASMLAPGRRDRPTAEIVRQSAYALLVGAAPPAVPLAPQEPAPVATGEGLKPEHVLAGLAFAALAVLVVFVVVGLAAAAAEQEAKKRPRRPPRG